MEKAQLAMLPVPKESVQLNSVNFGEKVYDGLREILLTIEISLKTAYSWSGSEQPFGRGGLDEECICHVLIVIAKTGDSIIPFQNFTYRLSDQCHVIDKNRFVFEENDIILLAGGVVHRIFYAADNAIGTIFLMFITWKHFDDGCSLLENHIGIIRVICG